MNTLKRVAQCFILLSLMCLFVVSPLISIAAEEGKLESANCFDYYDFGSVDANLSPSVEVASVGSPITFSGDLVNKNPYPVVNGQLYVKVYRSIPEGEGDWTNGPHTVDWFLVKDDITLGASTTPSSVLPIEFAWQVPAWALSGEYKLATYFTSDHKFNLSGLSFTDDITGNLITFNVVGEQQTSVYFDREGTTLNGERYYFVGDNPRVEDSESATIDSTIVNTTTGNLTVPVTWKIYNWDGINEDNLIRTEKQDITVPAGGSAVTSIEVSDIDHSVYYAIAELQYQDTKSLVNVRFVRENISSPRINFPAVFQYPLEKGKTSTIFSCLHNTTGDIVTDGVLTLTLSSPAGIPFYSTKYEGNITGEMMGLKSDFVPEGSYKDFNLTAELEIEGRLIEKSVMEYRCADIIGSDCGSSPWKWIVGILVAIILLGLIATLIRRNK